MTESLSHDEGAKVDQGILERGEWLPDKHITAIDS